MKFSGASAKAILVTLTLLQSQTTLSASQSSESGVRGFADLHNHLFSEYAYGGAWLHGKVEGPIQEALPPCSGNANFLGRKRDHARTVLSALNEFISQVPGTQGDAGWHASKPGGYPDFKGWPRWDTIAHQQNWEGHLKQAFQQGLTLSVVSMVNFEPLCKLMPVSNRKYSCDDMSAVDRQVDAATRFAQKNNDWVEIALDPEHTRDIIKRGKMALVLAIEVSDLFSKGDWREQLDYFYDRGIRVIQPVHQLDNRFAGTAPHHFIFGFFQILRNIKYSPWEKNWGVQKDDNGKNKLGLTEEGRELIHTMMQKRMLIDLSHLSEKSVREVGEIALANGQYPLLLSHGHVREMMTGKALNYEKPSPNWVLQLIRTTGGMFGIRTGPEKMKTFGNVPNDCDGSSKSFAQHYQYADKVLDVNMGFGSDFNGFIQQIRPRFGGKKESCGAADSKKERDRQRRKQANPLGEDFDHTGYGHIGQIGSLIRELKNLGVDLSNIERSSDSFVQMWQRAYDRAPGNLPVSVDSNRNLANQ